MTEILKTTLGKILRDSVKDQQISITKSYSISGGCINEVHAVNTNTGETFLLKYNDSSPSQMFKAEYQGLEELSKNKSLRIPKVFSYSDKQYNDQSFILMEYISSSAKTKKFYEIFGRGFADLHRITNNQYGFSEDNYIGSTPQVNGWDDDWVSFFREKRLGYQIGIAKKNNYWSTDLDQSWEKLSHRLDELIGEPKEPPSLLHGDLWSGNYIVGPSGEPCLIDPSVYYGSREADLSMTELFGGFNPQFYDAYKESYPLESGYKERFNIYKLYHLLNHLNLFGTSYLGSIQDIMKRYTK